MPASTGTPAVRATRRSAGVSPVQPCGRRPGTSRRLAVSPPQNANYGPRLGSRSCDILTVPDWLELVLHALRKNGAGGFWRAARGSLCPATCCEAAGSRGQPAAQAHVSTRSYFLVFAVLTGIVVFAPLRTGDLAGYDDALFAHIAKGIVRSGDWINISSNGNPVLEHPPLLAWSEALLFSLFGISDRMARLPSALCGWGTILLVYWLGRRLLKDAFSGLLAMLVMATSIYFLKYAAKAMTDVPITFLFVCAVCCWLLAESDARWYLAVGVFTALALLTRGFTGFALPAMFALDYAARRRPVPLRYLLPALAIALVPLAAWYAHMITTNSDTFFTVHSAWLEREVYGSLTPPWRRYTGLFEYLGMLLKSYWPWLPFMVAGVVIVFRQRDRRLWLLPIWAAVMLALCGAAKSRVLRYMLPAYPAFAVLAALAIARFVPEQRVRQILRVATPVVALGVVLFAIFYPVRWHADEIRPIAVAATAATPEGRRIGLYDAGQPRWDEVNQLQWYGERCLILLQSPEELQAALRAGSANVFIVDVETYAAYFANRPGRVVASRGHLICVQLET